MSPQYPFRRNLSYFLEQYELNDYILPNFPVFLFYRFITNSYRIITVVQIYSLNLRKNPNSTVELGLLNDFMTKNRTFYETVNFDKNRCL